jgi:hypothetical protein
MIELISIARSHSLSRRQLIMPRRQFQSVRDGLAREGDDAPDGHASDRYRAFLFARRHPHHVRLAAARCHHVDLLPSAAIRLSNR